MLPPAFYVALTLLLCDAAFVSLLGLGQPSLALLGVPAAWLEAALRLLALWGVQGLLSLRWPSPIPLVFLASLCLLPPLYLSVGPWFGDPPFLLSSASWAWQLLGYGVVAAVHLTWWILGQGTSQKATKKDRATLWELLRLSRPDVPYLISAFVFLSMAVIGEWDQRQAPSLLGMGEERGPGRQQHLEVAKEPKTSFVKVTDFFAFLTCSEKNS